MFKNLYNNLVTLHVNFKTLNTINIYSFIKNSIAVKNYLNTLNFQISILNQLKSKSIQTSFWIFSLDLLLPVINSIVLIWIGLELFIGL